jgi:hypothetical protein
LIAALIAVISLAALLEFFISYCRSLIAASSKVELSEQVREVAGLQSQPPGGEEFGRLLQLVRLCPASGDDRIELGFIGAYYRLLNAMRGLSAPIAPGLAGWTEHERGGCAYFAAVALDRRIAYSRELLAQQMGNRA